MTDSVAEHEPVNMEENSRAAAQYLKGIAHEGRLMILCHLYAGEKSVGTLEELLGIRQAAVSQLLSRLREEGLVQYRREGKTVFYRLNCDDTRTLIEFLYNKFCAPSE